MTFLVCLLSAVVVTSASSLRPEDSSSQTTEVSQLAEELESESNDEEIEYLI